MQPEEYEELAALTQAHDELVNRLAAKGVQVSVTELMLTRIEHKLDLLLGENVPRALLNYQRQLEENFSGVEEQLDAQIARQKLLGNGGRPIGRPDL